MLSPTNSKFHLCKFTQYYWLYSPSPFLPLFHSPLATIPLIFVDNSFDWSFWKYIWRFCAAVQDCDLATDPYSFCEQVVTVFIAFWVPCGLRIRNHWAGQWIFGSGEGYEPGLSHLYYAGAGQLAWTVLSWDASEMCGEQSGHHRERQKECQAISEPPKCQQSAECRGPEAWHGTYLGSGKRSWWRASSLPCLVS